MPVWLWLLLLAGAAALVGQFVLIAWVRQKQRTNLLEMQQRYAGQEAHVLRTLLALKGKRYPAVAVFTRHQLVLKPVFGREQEHPWSVVRRLEWRTHIWPKKPIIDSRTMTRVPVLHLELYDGGELDLATFAELAHPAHDYLKGVGLSVAGEPSTPREGQAEA